MVVKDIQFDKCNSIRFQISSNVSGKKSRILQRPRKDEKVGKSNSYKSNKVRTKQIFLKFFVLHSIIHLLSKKKKIFLFVYSLVRTKKQKTIIYDFECERRRKTNTCKQPDKDKEKNRKTLIDGTLLSN
jgi:hypothetical protein